MAEASNSKLTLSFVTNASIVSVGLTIVLASDVLALDSGIDIVYKYITKKYIQCYLYIIYFTHLVVLLLGLVHFQHLLRYFRYLLHQTTLRNSHHSILHFDN
jgi:hypothetical protein